MRTPPPSSRRRSDRRVEDVTSSSGSSATGPSSYPRSLLLAEVARATQRLADAAGLTPRELEQLRETLGKLTTALHGAH